MKRFAILLLTAALILSLCGCASWTTVRFSDMEYVRPDLDDIQAVLEESCAVARESRKLSRVEDAIWAFYEAYDGFYTNFNLAYIYYCQDVTDLYWQQENEFFNENYATVDAGLEQLYQALAASPVREQLETDEYFGEGFFDAYEGESFYDETVLALLEQEMELLNSYYDLYAETTQVERYSDEFFDRYAQPLCQILVELVKVRQELAEYCGYDDYNEFCYDYYYYRDYTWQEAQLLLTEVQSELVELYRQVNEDPLWDKANEACATSQTYAYLEEVAQAMGGQIQEAFQVLDAGELCDITPGENKYEASFEVYLTSYYQPFIFVNPTQTQWDKLTLTHEFGHFVNDYVSYGSYCGNDVEEVFSQGLEYLSLCYVEDDVLERVKLADCLATYVEQAAYACFEHRLYTLEEVTAETVFALYEQVGLDYGFDSLDWDPRDVVTVTHFYSNPMYIVSYVVSNDAAFQLYQLEREQPGEGLALYESQLGTGEQCFRAFLQTTGLSDPFQPDHVAAVRQTLEDILK